MSLNAYQLYRAQARGLGNTNDEWGDIFGAPSTGFGGGSNGNWYQDWGGGLINQAGQILVGIFGNRNQTAQLQQQLLLQQQAAQQAALLAAQQRAAAGLDPNDPAGTRVASGLSQAWSDLARTIGISPGTLTMVVVGGVALAFMKPPGRGRG